MPYPDNVRTAREVEQVVRDNGAVPATIAILDGIIRVGTFSSFFFGVHVLVAFFPVTVTSVCFAHTRPEARVTRPLLTHFSFSLSQD